MQEKKEINAFVDGWKYKEDKETVLIKFLDKDGNSFYFDHFLLKKDGTPNKNTINVIRACGFKSNNLSDFTDTAALIKGKEVLITVVKNEKGYDKIEFVNELGGSRDVVSTDHAKRALSVHPKLAALNSALNAIPFEDDDSIPF